MNKKAFGIDLGTTYSCISYVDDISKEPVVVDNLEGMSVTPSVVYFEEGGNICVGEVAKATAIAEPERTCEFVKRRMGRDKVAITVDDTEYSPVQVSAMIIQKLVKDAEQALDTEISDVVITCPAYFGAAEKQATEDAGKMAGLNVLQIINEPTAAALCYGSLRNVKDKTILVYDLGGGTFDVTIIHVTSEEIVAIATEGDHQLGGMNWDAEIMNYLENEFREQTDYDGEFDLWEQQELRISAERAKQQLTGRISTKVTVGASGSINARIELTREKFDEITGALLRRTIDCTNLAIEEAKEKGCSQIDEIILVGGSCKMPQVQELVEKTYPGIPIKMYEPDHAVAMGAALHADNLDKRSEKGSSNGGVLPPGPELKNITSKSYGLKVLTEELDEEGKRISKITNLISKQDEVPAEITREFGTAVANARSAELVIYETDIRMDPPEAHYDIGMHKPFGKAVLSLPPGLPEGHSIEVRFSLSTDGLLKVRGFEAVSQNEVETEIRSESNVILTEEEFRKQQEEMNKLKMI